MGHFVQQIWKLAATLALSRPIRLILSRMALAFIKGFLDETIPLNWYVLHLHTSVEIRVHWRKLSIRRQNEWQKVGNNIDDFMKNINMSLCSWLLCACYREYFLNDAFPFGCDHATGKWGLKWKIFIILISCLTRQESDKIEDWNWN